MVQASTRSTGTISRALHRLHQRWQLARGRQSLSSTGSTRPRSERRPCQGDRRLHGLSEHPQGAADHALAERQYKELSDYPISVAVPSHRCRLVAPLPQKRWTSFQAIAIRWSSSRGQPAVGAQPAARPRLPATKPRTCSARPRPRLCHAASPYSAASRVPGAGAHRRLGHRPRPRASHQQIAGGPRAADQNQLSDLQSALKEIVQVGIARRRAGASSSTSWQRRRHPQPRSHQGGPCRIDQSEGDGAARRISRRSALRSRALSSRRRPGPMDDRRAVAFMDDLEAKIGSIRASMTIRMPGSPSTRVRHREMRSIRSRSPLCLSAMCDLGDSLPPPPSFRESGIQGDKQSSAALDPRICGMTKGVVSSCRPPF